MAILSPLLFFYGKKSGLVHTKPYICTHKNRANKEQKRILFSFCKDAAYFRITKLVEMLDTVLISLLIVAICIALLGLKVFFVKGGKFPNGHVSGNKAMRERGIGCAQSQDREAQKKPRFSIDELEKALNDSMN